MCSCRRGSLLGFRFLVVVFVFLRFHGFEFNELVYRIWFEVFLVDYQSIMLVGLGIEQKNCGRVRDIGLKFAVSYFDRAFRAVWIEADDRGSFLFFNFFIWHGIHCMDFHRPLSTEYFSGIVLGVPGFESGCFFMDLALPSSTDKSFGSLRARALSFRKKPVVIEAMQYDGTNGEAIEAWSQSKVRALIDMNWNPYLSIETLEGTITGIDGDWIIRGVKGEYYPCKPDIFDATYEPVLQSANAGSSQPVDAAEKSTNI